MQVLLVLVRSLRALEKCRRDFIIMLGNRTHLAATHREMLSREDVIFHSTPVLFDGVPTADNSRHGGSPDIGELSCSIQT